MRSKRSSKGCDWGENYKEEVEIRLKKKNWQKIRKKVARKVSGKKFKANFLKKKWNTFLKSPKNFSNFFKKKFWNFWL
jgi:hypothetical protein